MPDRLTDGGLHAAITSALVGIHAEYLGHGPTRAATFHHDLVVVTLMYDVLTKAERILAQDGSYAAVRNTRELYRSEMEADFRAAVERLTGRRVVAYMGANEMAPDMAAEIFVLGQAG